jgi:hypothetical protein
VRWRALNTKTEKLNPGELPEVGETDEMSKAVAAAPRRAFVEPEVSFPIDVLESTTFFQFTESGATN